MGSGDASSTAAPPPTVYVSLQGNDTTCARNNRQRPCQSLDRAYAVARLGDTVELAAGDYPPQTIFEKPDKAGAGNLADVVIRPAAKARVRLADLTLGELAANKGPDHITIMGLSDWQEPQPERPGGSCEWQLHHGTTDVTWKDLRACNFYMIGAKDIRILGGVWGPCTTDGSSASACANNKIDFDPGLPTERVVIDGAVVRDYRVVPGSGAHFECLFVVGGWDVTIRRSKFENCAYFAVMLQYYGDINYPRMSQAPFNRITIENNFFGPVLDEAGRPNRWTAIWFSHLNDQQPYEFANVIIRYNSFYKASVSFNGGHEDFSGFTLTNVRLYANILERTWQPCPPITQGHNIWVLGEGRRACHASDTLLRAYPYRAPERGDYHLVTGAAVDAVPGRASDDLRSTRDIDGDLRPLGKAHDAGADETRPPKRPTAASKKSKRKS
jgi:hypothetical protein